MHFCSINASRVRSFVSEKENLTWRQTLRSASEMLLMHECTCTGIHSPPPQPILLLHRHNNTLSASHVFVSIGSDFKPTASRRSSSPFWQLFLYFFLFLLSRRGELLAVKGGQRKQRNAVKKPLKEYFPFSSFVRPLLRLAAAPNHTNKCKWMWNLSTEREGPPFERGAEWALKESLINLSTAPIGPLGIFFYPLYLNGRAEDGGRGE